MQGEYYAWTDTEKAGCVLCNQSPITNLLPLSSIKLVSSKLTIQARQFYGVNRKGLFFGFF